MKGHYCKSDQAGGGDCEDGNRLEITPVRRSRHGRVIVAAYIVSAPFSDLSNNTNIPMGLLLGWKQSAPGAWAMAIGLFLGWKLSGLGAWALDTRTKMRSSKITTKTRL